MLKVEILGYSQLPESVKENERLPDNGAGKEWTSYLIVKNGEEIIRVESCAMEPEDASFWRDLKWVKDAIMEAYNLGLNENE